jgi:uncharacterized membrane protein
MEILDRYGISPELAWLSALLAGVVAIAGAAVAFTERVYWGFLWQYFWGPVHADADGADCYVYRTDEGTMVGREDPNPELNGPNEELFESCADSAYEATAFVAEPGYTVVSTLGYITVLVFMLGGVYLLFRNVEFSPYKQFFLALVPFMLFGGALRTVEDAFVAALDEGVTPALEFPASALLISPFIYFTVFGIATASFFLSKSLHAREVTDTYTYPLGTIGAGVLAATVGYLLYLSQTTEYIAFEPTVTATILGLATVSAVLVYLGAERFWPVANAATGVVGLVIVWGHAVDGFANVLANDWTQVWDLGVSYSPKHPFNEFIINTTSSLQGGDEIAGIYVGEAWPFALVKLAVPLAIVALFDEEFFDESPRFAIMLLGAIIAVGLGPGTRDMLRFTFGI